MPIRHVARAGFSLMELIIVIAIISVLAALAAPRYSGSISRYQVSAAARKVAADLTYAQARARAVSTTRIVAFSVTGSNGPATNTYQLLSEPDPNVPAKIYTVDLTSNPYYSTIASVNFNGSGTVSFNAYGTPSNAGSIVLQSGSATSTVLLDGTSGTVTIQ